MLEKAGESTQGHAPEGAGIDVCLFVVLRVEGGKPVVGLPQTFVSNILITSDLNHISVLPQISHHSPLPVVSLLLKPLSLPLTTLVSPATFLSDYVSRPLVSRSTRESKRILTTERSEWPKALLLSHGYYDRTFVCVFADI